MMAFTPFSIPFSIPFTGKLPRAISCSGAIGRLALWPLLLVLLVLLAPLAQAYSYAAAGKEPLIDGREALLGAVNAGDWDAAGKAFEALRGELDYLTAHHAPTLMARFETAMKDRDAQAVADALIEAFVVEIDRRLSAAGNNLNDYQTARALVVKSHRLFQAMAGEFDGTRHQAAEAGLKAALEAIGNPGVFGVGAKAADAKAFAQAHQAVMTALRAGTAE